MKNQLIILKFLVVGAALVSVVTYLILGVIRISFPYELEWMEGGAVDHTLRILSNQPLYVKPSLEFTPYFYTPFYFYLSALVAKVVGIGFLPLRLVSFVASIGCFLLIYRLVKGETNSPLCGLVSVGVFAATFKLSAAWLDIARVDSLFLFFLLWGVILLWTGGERIRTQLLTGLVMFLAFFTKQTALMIAAPLCVYALLMFKGWSRLIFPLVFSALVLGSTLILNIRSAGWYWYYVFDLPRQHAFIDDMYINYWFYDLKVLAPALFIAIFYLLFLFSKKDDSRYKKLLFFSCLFFGFVGASWLSRLHNGGFYNVLIPAFAVLSIFLGLGMGVLLKALQSENPNNLDKNFSEKSHIPRGSEEEVVVRDSHLGGIVRAFIYAVVLAQFFMLFYYPQDLIPPRSDVEAGDFIVDLIKKFEGPVYIPNHGYFSAMAGKETYVQAMAANDVLRGTNEVIKEAYLAEIRGAIDARIFDAIILDDRGLMEPWIRASVERNYFFEGEILNHQELWPISGHTTRPFKLYIRR